MKTTHLFLKQYNWRMLLMRIVVNMLALLFTVALTPNVYFVDVRLASWILMALGLALITAFVKPIIQFLTLRFIFATGGLVVVIINMILLYLLEWLMPQWLAIDGLLWGIAAGLVLGISSTVLEDLFGLTPPIVSEKYPEIRQRVKDRQFYRMQYELSRIDTVKKGRARQLAAAKTMMVESSPAVSELFAKSKDSVRDMEISQNIDTAALDERIDTQASPPVVHFYPEAPPPVESTPETPTSADDSGSTPLPASPTGLEA